MLTPVWKCLLMRLFRGQTRYLLGETNVAKAPSLNCRKAVGCSLPSNVQFATWVRKRSGILLEMAGQLDRLNTGLKGFQVAIVSQHHNWSHVVSLDQSKWFWSENQKITMSYVGCPRCSFGIEFPLVASPWPLVPWQKRGWFTGRDQPRQPQVVPKEGLQCLQQEGEPSIFGLGSISQRFSYWCTKPHKTPHWSRFL